MEFDIQLDYSADIATYRRTCQHCDGTENIVVVTEGGKVIKHGHLECIYPKGGESDE